MVITKPTLLIVDDDASIRNTLTLIFINLVTLCAPRLTGLKP